MIPAEIVPTPHLHPLPSGEGRGEGTHARIAVVPFVGICISLTFQ
jgi:hypothetical protein